MEDELAGPDITSRLADVDHAAFLLFQYAPGIALTFLALEFVSHIDIEVACIWRRPFTHVRLLYILARYGALRLQCAASQTWITRYFHSANLPWDVTHCKTWLLIHVYSAHALHLLLVLHMAARVYALYAFDVRIRNVLAFLVVLDLGTATCITYFSVKKNTFAGACEPHSPPIIQYYAVGTGLPQLSLLGLTLYKRWSLHSKAASNIINVVTRDGGWTFGVVACE
ncbi:hypothetical protein BD626DRAFT_475103 [Schizophyllum amplum]|uniref:DUF6533 domain-containing protein n=1 Tax=Schizophyllum amplum TaxID=97359 RepID=A0A550CY52_9AGAR|nr:hypothetical protein BD626DRAFT_475103 [Auriculariopsis ampla]